MSAPQFRLTLTGGVSSIVEGCDIVGEGSRPRESENGTSEDFGSAERAKPEAQNEEITSDGKMQSMPRGRYITDKQSVGK